MYTQITNLSQSSLRAGQTLRLYAENDTGIIVTKGAVSIADAPLWSADQFLHQSTTLSEGELYVVQRRGWIAINAHRPAEILCDERFANAVNPCMHWIGTMASIFF